MEYHSFDGGFVLRLDPGDEVIGSLTSLAEAEGLELASVSGLGAAGEISLGLFDTRKKEYGGVTYRGQYEIASLGGNITRKDGAPYLHLHIVIANPLTGECHGGHLREAVISATAEIFVQTWSGRVGRKFSEAIGLNLFEF